MRGSRLNPWLWVGVLAALVACAVAMETDGRDPSGLTVGELRRRFEERSGGGSPGSDSRSRSDGLGGGSSGPPPNRPPPPTPVRQDVAQKDPSEEAIFGNDSDVSGDGSGLDVPEPGATSRLKRHDAAPLDPMSRDEDLDSLPVDSAAAANLADSGEPPVDSAEPVAADSPRRQRHRRLRRHNAHKALNVPSVSIDSLPVDSNEPAPVGSDEPAAVDREAGGQDTAPAVLVQEETYEWDADPDEHTFIPGVPEWRSQIGNRVKYTPPVFSVPGTQYSLMGGTGPQASAKSMFMQMFYKQYTDAVSAVPPGEIFKLIKKAMAQGTRHCLTTQDGERAGAQEGCWGPVYSPAAYQNVLHTIMSGAASAQAAMERLLTTGKFLEPDHPTSDLEKQGPVSYDKAYEVIALLRYKAFGETESKILPRALNSFAKDQLAYDRSPESKAKNAPKFVVTHQWQQFCRGLTSVEDCMKHSGHYHNDEYIGGACLWVTDEPSKGKTAKPGFCDMCGDFFECQDLLFDLDAPNEAKKVPSLERTPGTPGNCGQVQPGNVLRANDRVDVIHGMEVRCRVRQAVGKGKARPMINWDEFWCRRAEADESSPFYRNYLPTRAAGQSNLASGNAESDSLKQVCDPTPTQHITSPAEEHAKCCPFVAYPTARKN